MTDTRQGIHDTPSWATVIVLCVFAVVGMLATARWAYKTWPKCEEAFASWVWEHRLVDPPRRHATIVVGGLGWPRYEDAWSGVPIVSNTSKSSVVVVYDGYYTSSSENVTVPAGETMEIAGEIQAITVTDADVDLRFK